MILRQGPEEVKGEPTAVIFQGAGRVPGSASVESCGLSNRKLWRASAELEGGIRGGRMEAGPEVWVIPMQGTFDLDPR